MYITYIHRKIQNTQTTVPDHQEFYFFLCTSLNKLIFFYTVKYRINQYKNFGKA